MPIRPAPIAVSLALAASALAVGCAKPKREPPQVNKLLEVAGQPSLAEVVRKRTLYDAEGNLLPSEQVLSGLTLPRGLTRKRAMRRRWVYESRVPVDKLRRYFGLRLITGQIRPGGGGITYVAATPREAKGGVVKLDVKVGDHPSTRGIAVVDIRELPPPPINPPSDRELRQIMKFRAQRAD
ncbi:MAG: hypothetical protein MJD61_08455 [Proteobacteria bacterium]|nr:hypothetical protein [Pseudomonadota bacterium]